MRPRLHTVPATLLAWALSLAVWVPAGTAGAAPFAFVTNQGDDSVSVLDLAAGGRSPPRLRWARVRLGSPYPATVDAFT